MELRVIIKRRQGHLPRSFICLRAFVMRKILYFFTQHYHFKDNFKQNVHQCIRVLSTTALQLKNQFGYRAKS